MRDAGICWTPNSPGSGLQPWMGAHATFLRVRVPWRAAGFDHSDPLYETGGMGLAAALGMCLRLDLGILITFDACYPETYEWPNAYHRKPHKVGEEVRVQARECFRYVRHSGVRVVGVEVNNESDVMQWVSNHPTWEQLRLEWIKYSKTYRVVEGAVREKLGEDVPVIVGGANARWHRNRHGRHPSLNWWMIQEKDATDVAVHFGEDWTPDQVYAAVDELHHAPPHVWGTEFVYNASPHSVHDLLRAFVDAGGTRPTFWARNIFEEWQKTGRWDVDAASVERLDGSINHRRKDEVEEFVRYMGGPRGEVVEPEPEPEEPIKLIDWNKLVALLADRDDHIERGTTQAAERAMFVEKWRRDNL